MQNTDQAFLWTEVWLYGQNENISGLWDREFLAGILTMSQYRVSVGGYSNEYI